MLNESLTPLSDPVKGTHLRLLVIETEQQVPACHLIGRLASIACHFLGHLVSRGGSSAIIAPFAMANKAWVIERSDIMGLLNHWARLRCVETAASP